MGGKLKRKPQLVMIIDLMLYCVYISYNHIKIAEALPKSIKSAV